MNVWVIHRINTAPGTPYSQPMIYGVALCDKTAAEFISGFAESERGIMTMTQFTTMDYLEG